ncbi:MAG: hypothetical protein PHY80_05570 [Rickettsiales bacterium]|nr:hypothetical protein [Rickettsiales bacterium]
MSEKNFENNIFTYATSELSQDAFLFYLLNFANKDCEEGKLAREFLYKFTNNQFINNENYKNFKIYSYKQFLKIDVLLVFINERDANNSFILIIEDKINAYESKKEQLKSYSDEIIKKRIPEKDINGLEIEKYDNINNIIIKNIISIYFKTGTLDTKEILNNEKTINFKNICDIFQKENTNNIIIEQWKNRINKIDFLKKEIDKSIKNNKKIDDFVKMTFEYNYDGLEIMNYFGNFIFDGKCRINKEHKFYKSKTYNYETWRENSMGHPEFNLSIKPDFLYKEFNNDEYKKDNKDKKLAFSIQIRIRNFQLCIILETHELDLQKNKWLGYGTYSKDGLYKRYKSVDESFIKEKENFYSNIKNEFIKIQKDLKFKEIKIENMRKRNILLTTFDWEEVLELKINDFKDLILRLQNSLEKIAKNTGYKEQW